MFLFEGDEGRVLYTGDFRFPPGVTRDIPQLRSEYGNGYVKVLLLQEEPLRTLTKTATCSLVKLRQRKHKTRHRSTRKLLLVRKRLKETRDRKRNASSARFDE